MDWEPRAVLASAKQSRFFAAASFARCDYWDAWTSTRWTVRTSSRPSRRYVTDVAAPDMRAGAKKGTQCTNVSLAVLVSFRLARPDYWDRRHFRRQQKPRGTCGLVSGRVGHFAGAVGRGNIPLRRGGASGGRG